MHHTRVPPHSFVAVLVITLVGNERNSVATLVKDTTNGDGGGTWVKMI